MGGQKNLKVWWGKGAKDGSFLLRFETGNSIYHLVSAWTYGRVEIQFKLLSDEPPFDDVDKRLELLRLLNQIPGVSLERDAIDRRPSISLETLATAGSLAKLCTALEWLVEQATRAA